MLLQTEDIVVIENTINRRLEIESVLLGVLFVERLNVDGSWMVKWGLEYRVRPSESARGQPPVIHIPMLDDILPSRDVGEEIPIHMPAFGGADDMQSPVKVRQLLIEPTVSFNLNDVVLVEQGVSQSPNGLTERFSTSDDYKVDLKTGNAIRQFPRFPIVAVTRIVGVTGWAQKLTSSKANEHSPTAGENPFPLNGQPRVRLHVDGVGLVDHFLDRLRVHYESSKRRAARIAARGIC